MSPETQTPKLNPNEIKTPVDLSPERSETSAAPQELIQVPPEIQPTVAESSASVEKVVIPDVPELTSEQKANIACMGGIAADSLHIRTGGTTAIVDGEFKGDPRRVLGHPSNQGLNQQ